MKVYDYRELEVYKKAFDLQQKIFQISKKFPKEEQYSLTDQIRRSSRSIGANLAEAWKKRRYPAHFVSKLTDSDGELGETVHWLETSLACEYIESGVHETLTLQCDQVGKMLGVMIRDADKWCVNR